MGLGAVSQLMIINKFLLSQHQFWTNLLKIYMSEQKSGSYQIEIFKSILSINLLT